MSDDLCTILNDCFKSIANININDSNMIAIKLMDEFIRNNDRKSIDLELDKLIEKVFVNYEEKEYFNPGIPPHIYGNKKNNVDKKINSDAVNGTYKHADYPNSKIVIFDVKPNEVLNNHRYVVVKYPSNDNNLSDITINTTEYSKKSDGSIDYIPILTITHKTKYLAFVTGVINIFLGYSNSNGLELHDYKKNSLVTEIGSIKEK